jgi:hypothetical protein
MKITASIEQQSPVPAFAATLLNAVTVLHMMHLQTKSFAQHSALSFYNDFGDMADKFVEQYQGIYGLMTSYPQQTVVNIKDPVSFVTELHTSVEMMRRLPGFPQDTCLQNVVDEISGMLAQALYKLRFLA